MGALRAGGPLDLVFHHIPQIGPPLASSYRKVEATHAPDVIHAHYLTTGYLVGSVTSAPLVVSTYGFDVSVLPRRKPWRAALRQLATRASFIFVEGPFMRRAVAALGVPYDRIVVVPIAAKFHKITYRDPSLSIAGPRFLICGRLVPKKGHALALQAFANARAVLPPHATLEIVGDGPLRSDLEGLARRLRISAGVRFWGGLTRAAYLQRLSEADVLLAPSVEAENGDAEGGAPTTILDAQAKGVITVGSTHADIPFVIEDGATGFLFPEGDSEALAGVMQHALSCVRQWPEIARKARAQIDGRHSDEHVASIMAHAYARSVDEAG